MSAPQLANLASSCRSPSGPRTWSRLCSAFTLRRRAKTVTPAPRRWIGFAS